MSLVQEWWVWALAGILMLALEVFAPGFLFLGFSIGAGFVSALIAVGFLGGSLPVLILVFAIVSLLAWYGLRQVFGVRKNQIKIWDTDINED